MSCARMRPSASESATVSTSSTLVTRAAIRPTASSTDIIGPPKAKQSSDSCAMRIRSLGGRFREKILDRDRRPLDQGGDRIDVVEMSDRQPGLNFGIGHDADNAGIVG